MAIPASGALTFAMIQTEFGGSNPIGLNEYYRGGGLVPNIGTNTAVPTSGTISLSNFYSSANTPGTFSALPNSGAAILALYAIDSNGTLRYNESTAPTSSTWVTPANSTVAGAYEVRVDVTAGGFTSGSATATWLACTSNRSWSVGGGSCTFTISFRIATSGVVQYTQSGITAAA